MYNQINILSALVIQESLISETNLSNVEYANLALLYPKSCHIPTESNGRRYIASPPSSKCSMMRIWHLFFLFININ